MIGRRHPEGLGVALNNDDTLPDGLRQAAFTSYVSLNPPSPRTEEASRKDMADGLYLSLPGVRRCYATLTPTGASS